MVANCKITLILRYKKNMLVHTLTLAPGEADAGELKFEVREVT